MSLVQGLGYVALGTSDMDEALGFYTTVARLQVSERRPRTAFLRGGMGHHWLRFDESDQPGCNRIAYEVPDEAALAEVTRRLDARGIPWVDGGSLDEDRVERWIRFHEPNGMEIELFTNMVQEPVPPGPTGIVMDEFLHAVVFVEDASAAECFFHDVLEFETSDRIGEFAVFMRCGNLYHHSLALLQVPGVAGRLDHFCVEVGGLDDVMLVRNNALKLGVPLRNDLLRHAPSGSFGIYLQDPVHGHSVEFCHGHMRVTDPDYQPRLLEPLAETVDVWKASLPEIKVPPAGP